MTYEKLFAMIGEPTSDDDSIAKVVYESLPRDECGNINYEMVGENIGRLVDEAVITMLTNKGKASLPKGSGSSFGVKFIKAMFERKIKEMGPMGRMVSSALKTSDAMQSLVQFVKGYLHYGK